MDTSTIFFKIKALLLAVFSCCGLLLQFKMAPKDAGSIKLSVACISDTHIKDDAGRKNFLNLGLKNISRASRPVDAVLIAGDLTDNGNTDSYQIFYSILKKHSFNYVLAMGNHDTWGKDGFETSRNQFVSGYHDLTGEQIAVNYYAKVINGYTFIVLGSEKDAGCPAYLSDTQLQWLDQNLKTATADGKPVFVICHQPINNTHGLPAVWDEGGVGEQSDQLNAILHSYKNVFYISGHLHCGLQNEPDDKGYQTLQGDSSFHSLNLPCYMYTNERGIKVNGTGVEIEVYSDKVLLRGCNYSASSWYTNYEYNISLV